MDLSRYVLSGLLLAGTAMSQDLTQEARDLRSRAALYEHGRGVGQDYRQAYRLYCQSALLGDPLAAYSLGWMYFNGRGLPKRPELAVGWFKRAAKAGDIYAARMLVRYVGVQAQEDPDCRPEPPIRVAQVHGSRDRKLIENWVGQIAPSYFVDPELVLAVIRTESNFNVAALSSKNAQGLMQLIPATAERFGVRDLWNPLENIKGGTAYLHWLLRHFSGNVAWAVAAYNAGERTVEQYRGVPPYRETQDYVKRILGFYQKTLHPIPPPLAGSPDSSRHFKTENPAHGRGS
jgi:soluble lytic murein transglycosylase-like protein